ncbi:hypothetical protein HDG34_002513 [Paraburkholderia sp. HC6.4b]|uniref:hypothetical protein n=1 Tax=unclassified Paraburkholderia TaxID=2615204 RepID=UPI00162271C1|nr:MULTISPECIES: hypothetical protein [unclassified Paraburkholderia]MBB5408576.1 hypothetical protein [Paraburkholderia sp. HC6.4b]MBB5450408.1 hypothetical protein [Paraburkholderia sp. Kb1A]
MSWLKIDAATPDKREVWAIAAALSLDRDAVVGKLVRVWLWFEQYSHNGNAPSVTTALVDALVNVSGFADAMITVHWLSIENGGLSMPHFDWHTGASANRRACTATRVSRHKSTNGQSNAEGNAESNAAANAEGNASVTHDDEKCVYVVNLKPSISLKPKNKNIRTSRFNAHAWLVSLGVDPQIADDWLTLRSGKRLKPTETAFAGVLREAQKAGLPLSDALRTCCTRGWGSFQAAWLEDRAHGAQGPPFALTPLQQREAEHRRVAQGLTRMSGSADDVIEGAVSEVHRGAQSGNP